MSFLRCKMFVFSALPADLVMLGDEMVDVSSAPFLPCVVGSLEEHLVRPTRHETSRAAASGTCYHHVSIDESPHRQWRVRCGRMVV